MEKKAKVKANLIGHIPWEIFNFPKKWLDLVVKLEKEEWGETILLCNFLVFFFNVDFIETSLVLFVLNPEDTILQMIHWTFGSSFFVTGCQKQKKKCLIC